MSWDWDNKQISTILAWVSKGHYNHVRERVHKTLGILDVCSKCQNFVELVDFENGIVESLTRYIKNLLIVNFQQSKP
jgi:hypothetical protein